MASKTASEVSWVWLSKETWLVVTVHHWSHLLLCQPRFSASRIQEFVERCSSVHWAHCQPSVRVTGLERLTLARLTEASQVFLIIGATQGRATELVTWGNAEQGE